MELQLETRNAAYLCPVVEQTAAQEETAEVIVPDSYPDAEGVLYTAASAVLRSKECRMGSVVVSGTIRTTALYQPEDGSYPRVLEASIPFSIRMDHPSIAENLQARVRCYVRQADARVLNSRKVQFRVNVGCQLTGYESRNESLCILEKKPEALEVKAQTYPLRLALATGEKSFVVADDVALGASGGAISRICAFETTSVVRDTAIVGSRAVFKGDVLVKILYQTEDHSLAWAEGRLPYSQYCDLGQDHSDQSLDVYLCVTGAEAEPDAAAGKVLVSVSLAAYCLVQGIQEVSVTEDAYATCGTFTPQWQSYDFCCILDEKNLSLPLRSQLEADAARILFCQAFADAPQQRRTQDGLGLTISLPVRVQVLYSDKEGALKSAGEKLEVSTEASLAEHARCSASVCIEDLAATAGPGGIEIRGNAGLDLAFLSDQTLKNLCGGTLDQEAATKTRRPSVILRANRTTTPVWDLAKSYATTVDAIVQANNLTGDEVEAGQMVLIPM